MLLPTRRRRSPLFNPLASAALFGQTCAMKNSTPSPRLNALATAVPGHDIHSAFIDWATPRLNDARVRALLTRMKARSAIEHRWSGTPPTQAGGPPAGAGGYAADHG